MQVAIAAKQARTLSSVHVQTFFHHLSHLCGSLGYYDVSREKKISLKTPQPLQVYDRVFHKVTTTDDPVIRRVSTGAWAPQPGVPLSAIPSSSWIGRRSSERGRSLYPWEHIEGHLCSIEKPYT